MFFGGIVGSPVQKREIRMKLLLTVMLHHGFTQPLKQSIKKIWLPEIVSRVQGMCDGSFSVPI